MKCPKKIFVVFGGDPSKDKDHAKRSVSTEPIKTFPGEDCFEYVSREKYDRLKKLFDKYSDHSIKCRERKSTTCICDFDQVKSAGEL